MGQLLQRAEDELYDYDPAHDPDPDPAIEATSTATARGPRGAGGDNAEHEDEDDDDEEALEFWAHFRARQAAAAAQALRQARDFRREWSAANGLCHLRIVGRRILPPPPASEEGAASAAAAAVGATGGLGWEWHPPRGQGDAGAAKAAAAGAAGAAASESDVEAETGGEHPSGTARGYFGGVVGSVAGRGARLWSRDRGRRQEQHLGEEEEEVLAR